MLKLPSDSIGRLLVVSQLLLYLGIAVGLPLTLSHAPGSESPNSALASIGWFLLLVGFVAPVTLVGLAAKRLHAKWPLYALAAVLLWPLGTFICGLSLWDKRLK